jgi:hypothetical protein
MPSVVTRFGVSGVKRAIRIIGWIYVAGAVLAATIFLSGYYEQGFIPVKALPIDLAVVLLWPVVLAFIVASELGLGPPFE